MSLNVKYKSEEMFVFDRFILIACKLCNSFHSALNVTNLLTDFFSVTSDSQRMHRIETEDTLLFTMYFIV